MGQGNWCWMRVRYKAEFSLDLMLLKYHRWFLLGFGLMWQDWSQVSCSVRSSLEFSWAWGVEWDFSHTWSTRLSLSCLGVNLGPESAGAWSVHRNQSGLVWTQVLVFFSLTGICSSEPWHGAGVPGSWPFPLLIHGCFINFQLVTGEPQGVFAEKPWEGLSLSEKPQQLLRP